LTRPNILLLQRQHRWLGHVIRMPFNGLPRRILYGELLNGQRLPDGLKLRCKDHIRRILSKSNIPIFDLEKLATDGDSCESVCASGLNTQSLASDQAAEGRHCRRHNLPNPMTTGPRCPQCYRVWCASEFGLRSRPRSHSSHPPQHS